MSETKPHHYIIVTLTALGFLSLMRWQAITKDSMLIAGRPNQNTFAAETRLQNRDSILVVIKAGAIKNGLPESYLNEIFSYGGIAVHDKILDRFSKPYEKKSWTDYRKLFITESRIQKGVAFYTQYKNDLNSVSNQMNVDPFLILSIVGVESNYGRHKGKYTVFNALYTQIAKMPRRKQWATKELKNDTVIPSLINQSLKIPCFTPGIILEGGSVDANGKGTLITTEQCLLNKKRNPNLSKKEIEFFLMEYLMRVYE